MGSYSLAILVGKLTRDPELKYSPSGGLPYATLALAVHRNQAQPDGSVKKSVSFIDVSVWRHQAELCCQMLKKGSTVMVVGSIQQRRGGDEDRGRLQVVADRVQFLDRRVEAPATGEEA